ncbi:MAG: hypothetical protein WDO16_08615 [Bacteroidota bacterium]
MKGIVLSIFILSCLTIYSQSPSLGIHVRMDSAKTGSVRYKIEMKMCEPKTKTEKGSWFSHDTSAIDFISLKADDITCGDYFSKGMPELISGTEEKMPANSFTFSNQVFAWEKIFVFKISNQSSRAWWPEMYIVMPVKYKSFLTYIDLSGIEFQSGKVIFLNEYTALQNESALYVRQSLKNAATSDVKDFPLKELLVK